VDTTPAERYAWLVRAALSGGRVPRDEIDRIVEAAGKSYKDLAYDVLAGPVELPTMPGDKCDHCGGAIRVTSSRRAGSVLVRYLGCRACGRKPDRHRQVVPAWTVPKKTRKNRPTKVKSESP